jgi:uncharacterized membrane protein YkvI
MKNALTILVALLLVGLFVGFGVLLSSIYGTIGALMICVSFAYVAFRKRSTKRS